MRKGLRWQARKISMPPRTEKTVAEEIFAREYRRYLGEMMTSEGRCRVESEAVLPDYKEGVHRILRVDGKARVNSKNLYVQGHELICEIEGVASFHILYLSEERKESAVPTAFLTQENFSHRFKLSLTEETDPEEMAALIEAKCENTTAKLLGPRKISMRTDVMAWLSVKTNRSTSFYTEALPNDVQVRGSNVTAVSLASVCQEEIGFTETILLPKNYLPIAEICEMDVDVHCQKAQVTDGGIRITGNCDIQCSYISEGEENFVSFYQPIEFEKNLGIPQCEKDHIAELIMTPNFLKAVPDINSDGENKNILFEIGCSLEIRLYRNESLFVIEDVFSTETHLETETENFICEELLVSSDFSVTLRDALPAGEEKMIRTEGIRHHTEFKNSYLKEDKIVIEGRSVFRYLGIRENGDMTHGETLHDFQVSIPSEMGRFGEDGGDLRIEICGGARGVDLDPVGDKLELRYELCGHVFVFCRHRLVAIAAISRGEKKTKRERCLLFYYPEEGEQLWDVCKKYGVPPSALREENGLEGEVLPRVIRIQT